MASTATEPWWVPQDRATKASKIADVLRTIGATPDDVARFTDDDRREAEAAAAVRKGSAATWTLAVDMLAGSARTDALCPTCGRGDPEGVPGPRQRYRHTGPCSQ